MPIGIGLGTVASGRRRGGAGGVITHGHQVDGTNTGPAAAGYTNLTASGTITTDSDGQVIEAMHVTGTIRVRHDNVTVRGCHVNAGKVEGGTAYCINFASGTPTTGLLVEDCELEGADSASIVHFSPYTLRRTNIHDCVDGVKSGNGSVVEENYIHDCWRYGTPPNNTHSDGLQVRNGNPQIRRNRIEGPWQNATSAIITQSGDGAINGMTIEDNLLCGGGYALYLLEEGFAYTNVTVSGNYFAGEDTLPGIEPDGGGTWNPDNSWRFGSVSKSSGNTSSISGNKFAPITNRELHGTGGSDDYVSPVTVDIGALVDYNF